MSNLSDFLQKPYPGLTESGTDLQYQASAARLILGNTDTGSNSDYPYVHLRTDQQLVNAGGAIKFQAKNSLSAYLDMGVIRGKISAIAAGVESSQIDLTFYNNGTTRSASFNGGLLAIVPLVAGALSLGHATLPWASAIVGDGTSQAIFASAVAQSKIGTTTAHQLDVITNSVARLSVASAGQVAINTTGAIDASALLKVAGTHPNGANTNNGVKVDGTFPASTTVLGVGVLSRMTTAASAFTLTELDAFLAAEPTKGAGSVITTYMGFRCDASGANATNNFGAYLNVTAAGFQNFAVYAAGTAPSQFNGQIMFGTGLNTGDISINASGVRQWGLFVQNIATAGAIGVQGATTGNEVLLQIFNSAFTNRFSVNANGNILMDAAAQANNAAVTIAGRVSLAANTTFDLSGGTVAATQIQTGTVAAVPGSSFWFGNLLQVTVTVAGSGNAAGFSSNMTLTTAVTGLSYGWLSSMTESGAGTTIGAQYALFAAAGHSGSMIGAQYTLTPNGTSGVSYGARFLNQGTIAVTYGIMIDSTQPIGYGYGVLVNNGGTVSTAAFAWTQRAASTGAFLLLVDSGAATRFQVDVNGNMLLGGTGRRITGDMSNGVAANRVAFQTNAGNSPTYIGIIPSGTGVLSGITASGGSNPDAAPYILMAMTATRATLQAGNLGSATLAMSLQIDGVEVVQLATNKDVVIGPTGAVTAMASGFPYMPSAGGAPSGVPTGRAGFVPFYYDNINNFLYFYNGGWKKSTVYA